MPHVIKPVYQSLNKPRTLLGVERKLFFLILVVAVVMFNLFGALIPALALFVILWLAAKAATESDPQILRIVLSSHRLAARYDPAKWSRAPLGRRDSNHA